jgi:hypothetical protein
VLLAAGLLFAACLLAVVAVFATAWGLRSAWARLTGRPVVPFIFRVDPRAGFGRVYRRAAQQESAAGAEPARAQRGAIGDVTDVEAKPPRP